MKLISLFLSIPTNYNHNHYPNMMPLSRFKQWSIHITYLLIYCFTVTAIAQDKNTISQDSIIAFEKSLEGKPYYDVADVFYQNYRIDSKKSSIIIKYIKDHFLTVDNKEYVVDSHLIIAMWYGKIGKKDEAIELLDKGITIAKQINNTDLLYKGHLRKGVILFYAGDNIEAFDEFIKANNIAKEQNNIDRQLKAQHNITLVRIQANDNFGAIELAHKNLKIIQEKEEEKHQVLKIQIYLALCKAYINTEEYGKSKEYCNKGITLSEKLKILSLKGYFISGLGDIASSTGEFEQAYRYFDEAEAIMKELVVDRNFDIFMKLYRGKTYFFEGKYNKAVAELSKGEKMLEKYNVDFLSIEDLYYYLAKSYKELGNTELGLKYYDKTDKIDNKNDKKRLEISTNIVKKFDLPKLKEEIQGLISKAKRTKYFYYTGIGLLLFVIVGLVLFNRKQQKKNKERFSSLMNQLEEKRQKEKLQHKKEAPSLQAKTVHKTETIVEDLERKQSVKIDSKDAEILKKLIEFEQKELFLSQESTLVEVAKKIQTNTTYLSKVINTHKEKSFTAYITDLRVDYSIERLSHDRKFRSFTIGAIAQEIGFKRSESFSKAFKVKTGLYPSYFIKELEKQQLIKA